MKVVGLVGPKRSGKSTAADVLVRERGFVSIGFADALKDLALRVNPYIYEPPYETRPLDQIVEWRGWEEAKTLPSVRRFLQELGCGVRDIDSKFWLDALERKIAAMSREANVVIPDVRFENEAHYVRYCGWHDDRVLLIRITRPGLDLSDQHASETEQVAIKCDVEIINDGTSAKLQSQVLTAVDAWMGGD